VPIDEEAEGERRQSECRTGKDVRGVVDVEHDTARADQGADHEPHTDRRDAPPSRVRGGRGKNAEQAEDRDAGAA